MKFKNDKQRRAMFAKMIKNTSKNYQGILKDKRFSQLEGHQVRGENFKYNLKYEEIKRNEGTAQPYIDSTNKGYNQTKEDVKKLSKEDKYNLYDRLKEKDDISRPELRRFPDSDYVNDVITLGLHKRLFKNK